MLDGVINRFDLLKVYRVKTYDKAREKLSDRTVMGDDKKSGILTVTVTDRDPVARQRSPTPTPRNSTGHSRASTLPRLTANGNSSRSGLKSFVKT